MTKLIVWNHVHWYVILNEMLAFGYVLNEQIFSNSAEQIPQKLFIL